MRFAEKHVLVTGGAVRVGAAVVRAFAGAGARVTIHCRNNFEAAERLAAETGGRVVRADFSAGTAGAAALWDALDAPVDVLVNNASCYRLPEAERFLYDRVNFKAPVELMRRFAAQDTAEGAVVNFLDQAVLSAAPAEEPRYLESRRKLARATVEFARTFAGKNLRFNAVAPGPVLPPVGLEDSKMEKTLRSIPLRRPVALDDLIAAVIFLAANDSVTGAILPVDCGAGVFAPHPDPHGDDIAACFEIKNPQCKKY